ncbi:RNA-directed DNA polymerase, eukaryota, partial [Tanacetum coccineum]
WMPTFVGEDSESVCNDEGSLSNHTLEEEEVHEEEEEEMHEENELNFEMGVVPTDDKDVASNDSDPFGLESLINKKRDKDFELKSSATPDFPLEQPVDSVSSHTALGDSLKHVGFSLLERLEETIKVGLALGLNMEGCESTLAALIANNRDCKETKTIHVNLWMLRQVWGNSQFDFASMSARGLSGGIICTWTPNKINLMWIAIYAPQYLSGKIALWSSLATMIANWDGILVAMGDFNEVREAGERFDFYDSFPHITSVSLEKGIPDHRLILLKEHVVDFGPTPFRFFHSWLEMEGFHNLVVETWNNDGIVDANGLISFKKKLQHLKLVIREWIVTKRLDSSKTKKEHLSRLSSIDNMIDQGLATDVDLLNRCESIRIVDDLNRLENDNLAQKAGINWASEGDENTSFFHAMLKKNRRQLAIKGILNEGEWIENPAIIKNIFVEHFRNRFHQSSEPTPYFDVDMPNPISYEQSSFWERSFSRDEIKRAIWDCGGDRASGPDGFTFKFFTTFWDLLEADVIRFVQAFFLTGSFPQGCNSLFIALIPNVANATLVTDFRPISLIGCQYKIIGKNLANRLGAVIGSFISPEQSAFIKGRNILDGPLILNEVITWYRKHKKQLMIFKVDFEKAFDSLRWDFLDLVMAKLVNGSPTDEFEISRGLRQGDPLSLFLFILAMEGLHALICKAIDRGIFTGAYIGKDKLRISHLIYADDVIFTSEWSRKNAHNFLCILQCFYLVSGLKINVHKSSIMGICVSDADTSFMANAIGCGESKLPFKFLGVLVGCNMSRCANWDSVIPKISSKLSLWKARLTSVGGRLSLIKSVLSSLPTYFMSIYRVPVSICSKLESMRNKFFIGSEICEKKMTWVSWNKCLASRNSGGLGIGSIHALNAGLLFKWIWRFMQNSTELWARVIKVIHGNNGGIHVDFLNSPIQGTWSGNLSIINSLKLKGIDFLSLCTRKVRNSASIRFWDDIWRTPRGGIEASQLIDLQHLIRDVVLTDKGDSWICSPNISKGYSVASAHHLIDKHTLEVLMLTRFYVPCHEDVETVNHLFFTCDLAKDLWALLARWWELDIPFCTSISKWFEWLDSFSISHMALVFVEGVGWTLLWSI